MAGGGNDQRIQVLVRARHLQREGTSTVCNPHLDFIGVVSGVIGDDQHGVSESTHKDRKYDLHIA